MAKRHFKFYIKKITNRTVYGIYDVTTLIPIYIGSIETTYGPYEISYKKSKYMKYSHDIIAQFKNSIKNTKY